VSGGTLSLAETNGFALPDDDPPNGSMSTEWDGGRLAAGIDGATAVGRYTDVTVWILAVTAGGDAYDFGTDERRNVGTCSVTIERSDRGGMAGHVACSGLVGSWDPYASTPNIVRRPDRTIDAVGDFTTSSSG